MKAATNKVLSRLHRRENQLIESIYQCAAEPAHWHHFMGSLVDSMDARSARMLFMNTAADRVHDSLTFNIDEAFHQQYTRYYVNACPWRPELAFKPKGRLYSTHLDFTCDQKQFRRTEFYGDWAHPQGIEHGICGTVTADRHATVQFLVQRTREPGHFTQAETEFVNRRLLPHMRAALKLMEELEAQRARTAAAAQAGTRSPMPFILLDQRAQVSHLSDSAHSILLKHGLSIQSGRLVCRHADDHERLQKLVRKTLDSLRGEWREAGGRLTLKSGHGALEVMCLPLHPGLRERHFWEREFAALFLNEPERRLALNKAWVQEKFQFTDAEFSLAEALVNGCSLQEFAEQQGTSIYTVRTQCKTVLRKAGCPRQPALNRILLPYLAI